MVAPSPPPPPPGSDGGMATVARLRAIGVAPMAPQGMRRGLTPCCPRQGILGVCAGPWRNASLLCVCAVRQQVLLASVCRVVGYACATEEL